MGLLDDLVKSLEEAQREAEGRRRPAQRPVAPPERELDEDGAEWEVEEDDAPVRRAPQPIRREARVVVEVAPEPEAPTVPRRTVVSAPAELAPSQRSAEHAPATRIRRLITDQASIRDVFIAREILGPPPGLRRFRPR